MLLDVFNDEKAASLFYVTDLQVMIDIVLRNVTNSDPGSKVRFIYPSVLSHSFLKLF